MRRLFILFVLFFFVLFTGCDQGEASQYDTSNAGGVSAPTAEAAEGGEGAFVGAASESAPAASGSSAASTGDSASFGSTESGTAEAPVAGAEGGDPGVDGGMAESAPSAEPGGEVEGGTTSAPIQSGQLTAAEWRDLDNWAFFRSLFADVAEGQGQSEDSGAFAGIEETWGIFTAGRVPVIVQAGGAPVTNARVILSGPEQETLFEARTDNRGRAELFAGLRDGEEAQELSVIAFGADDTPAATVTEVVAGDDEPVVLDLGAALKPAANILDLMFVIDTTGSMGDELAYLQKELEDVIAQVVDQNSEDLQIRLSLNFYRDHGDLYVVRSNPFTTNISEAIEALLDESANGGGDYPEAVEDAMDDAIFNHSWSDDAVARMLFLVLDAPPHHNQATVEMLSSTLEEAARLGVRVFPLAASGVDKTTEALLRLMQVATGGSYLFLTDDSGIGNPHLEPTIGEHEVELLRDLLVRLINENVALDASVEPHGPIL